MKMEIWVSFDAGEIVEDFVVLDKVEFKAPEAQVALIQEHLAFPSMISAARLRSSLLVSE